MTVAVAAAAVAAGVSTDRQQQRLHRTPWQSNARQTTVNMLLLADLPWETAFCATARPVSVLHEPL